MVVDDNADMCLSMKLVLEHAGYEVETASDGEQAMALQRKRPVEVLITDLFMPQADGLETIQRFRQEYPAIRIIAMSGGSELAMKTDHLPVANVAGADATLRKPFEVETLLQTVRNG